MGNTIVMSEERFREILKEEIPDGNKVSPEDQYVTTRQLSKIMKVSVQMINTYKNDYGMTGSQGENLWDWIEALRWRREVYSKLTSTHRQRK